MDRFPRRRRKVAAPGFFNAAIEPAAGGLDRAVPGAFWRLLQVGERVGLINGAHRAALLELFIAPVLPPTLERVLRAFEMDRAQLYALVTLFSADPRPVAVPVLARECLCDQGAAGALLDHLERQELAACGANLRNGAARAALTELGRETAVYAIFRVINAAKEHVAATALGAPGPGSKRRNRPGRQ